MPTNSNAASYNEIWMSVRARIKEKYNHPEPLMNLWFKEGDIHLDILTEDTAVLVCLSDFRRDILYRRYLGEITDVMTEVLGFPVTVTIRSAENENEMTDKMTAAAEKSNTPIVPETDFYSTVGETKVLNRASVPAAYAEFTFENFVVGHSNQFAHAAALSVATHPAGQSNPLFIYGNSGLGKTHLLYAIAERIKRNFPSYKVVYVKGEEFTIQLIDAISRNLNTEFREKYRTADVLLIDDIQFIAGKESTQEEFFHTFNQLYENGKQIILASDLPPRDIRHLEERLRTRFECGVLADINPPDLELRTAIVKKKALNLGIRLPDDVLEYIAENLTNNIRQLEGAVKKICAQCMLTGTAVSRDLAVRCIADQVVGSEPVSVTIDKILAAVSQHYDIPVEDLKGRKRTSQIAASRHVAVYIIKKLTDSSLQNIGRVFKRDHTTMINSIETVEKKIQTDPTFDLEIKELIRTIKSQ